MLTVKQAAERLKCSSALVYQLCAERRLAHVRLGLGRGTIRIREDDLDQFVNNKTVQPNEAAPKLPPMKFKHLKL